MLAEVAEYIDTSALAKWYVREAGSDEFEAWIHQTSKPTVSSLTLLEMQCLLGRRRRNGQLDAAKEREIFALLREHVDSRLLAVEPVDDADVRGALHLMARIPAHALRALDAIHLRICASRRIDTLATADAVMAVAAEDLGIEVVRFD